MDGLVTGSAGALDVLDLIEAESAGDDDPLPGNHHGGWPPWDMVHRYDREVKWFRQWVCAATQIAIPPGLSSKPSNAAMSL